MSSKKTKQWRLNEGMSDAKTETSVYIWLVLRDLTMSYILLIIYDIYHESTMSDGPHRSLPMRPWWKQVALRADKSAFSVPDCVDALAVALEREFAEELRPNFLQGLQDAHAEPGLFSPAESLHFQKLATEAATPLECRVLDNIAVLSADELSEVDGLLTAVTNACRNEVPRFNKQIEEHFRRASGPSRARRERERLDEATARADVEGLARKLLRPSGPRTAPVLKKKTGLDEGVSLP